MMTNCEKMSTFFCSLLNFSSSFIRRIVLPLAWINLSVFCYSVKAPS